MTATYQGKPCKNGHIGLRYSSTGGCVECVRARANAIPYGIRKAAARKTELKKKYGITPQEYEQRLASQGGVCAICKQPPAGKDHAVDHCHSTGAVRGILCSKCNTGLGQFQDSPELLLNAVAYLSSHFH